MASPIHENCGSLPSNPEQTPRTVKQIVRISSPVNVPVLQTPSRSRWTLTKKNALKCLIWLVLGSIEFVPLVGIGSIYRGDCPREPFIPVLLVGFGVAGIVVYFSATIGFVLFPANTPSCVDTILLCVLLFLTGTFTMAWFCYICVRTLIIAFPTDTDYTNDSTSTNFCHPAVKYTVLAVTVFPFALVFVVCCCSVVIKAVRTYQRA